MEAPPSQSVSPVPANEVNEMQTFATIGYYGDGWADTVFPVRLTIVGDPLFIDGTSARGLSFEIPHGHRFATDTPFLIQADVLQFSTTGETTHGGVVHGGVYPNHCQHLYPTTTHRVRLVLNGGATLDGVHPVLPNQTDLFELISSSGERVTDPVLGLADLGSDLAEGHTSLTYRADGDNFLDVCLDSSKGSIGTIAKVRMPCDTIQLVLPKGKPVCTDNSINVTMHDVGYN
eukprot:TRINITY_DN31698_c0_g1_i1.p1 TRINITY_DN31698_c0_g1~~TRINITY_DN31698_c0_g1_i1.p1  ORF type:complete len:232 (+),score=27.07 TRINITY_DN31698_c0_g1_i1:334-1029(+)